MHHGVYDAGLYVNGCTTKLKVVGATLFDGFRRVMAKHRNETADVAIAQGKLVSKTQGALWFQREMLHLVARLHLKRGCGKVFQTSYGHMLSSSHQILEVHTRYSIVAVWEGWASYSKRSLSFLRQKSSNAARGKFNMFLPTGFDIKGLEG